MSSAVLLDTDFGSESEDDNFNPAPADDSDIEDAGVSNDELGSNPGKKGVDQSRTASGNDSKAPKGASQRNGHRNSGDDAGLNGDDGQNDSDHNNGNGAKADEEEEEDLEDDEDDEDDDEPVCLCISPHLCPVSDHLLRVGHENGLVETPETNISMLRPKLTRKMRATKRTRKDKQTRSSRTHIRTTLQTFRWVRKPMTGGIESLIANVIWKWKWTPKSKRKSSTNATVVNEPKQTTQSRCQNAFCSQAWKTQASGE